MQNRNIPVLLLLAAALFLTGFASGQPERISEQNYYRAFAGNNLASIDSVIADLANDSSNKARLGAMMMKKAGLLKHAQEKVKVFAEGRELLESAIAADPENPEYRFLRLVIQQNAPPFLKYRDNLDSDKGFVLSHIDRLSPYLQTYVKNYFEYAGQSTGGDKR